MKMRKIEEVEILRAFAILGVVVIHVISSNIYEIEDHSSYIFVINIILNLFSHFAVPLFFLISGFILGLKYKGKYNVTEYYRKRILSTITPYVLFSLIYILFNYFKLPEKYPLTLSNISFRLLTGSAFVHTWFFIVLIQFYILFPWFCKLINKVDSKKTYVIIFLCLCILQSSWNTFLMKFLTHPYFVDIAPYIRNIFFSHVIYFISGMLISKNFDTVQDKLNKIKSMKMISIIIVSLSALSYIKIAGMENRSMDIFYKFVLNTFNIPLYLCTFVLLFKLSRIVVRSNKYLKSLFRILSDYSFGIYLIHFLVIIMIRYISKSFSETYYLNWQFYLFNFTMTVLLSTSLVKLITLLPLGKAIVGVKKRSL